MRVVVDFDLCESNALCVGAAPTVFSLDDNDYLDVREGELDEDEVEGARAAVMACPKQAITIVE